MPSGFVPQLVMILLRPPFLMAAPPVLVHGFVHAVITLFPAPPGRFIPLFTHHVQTQPQPGLARRAVAGDSVCHDCCSLPITIGRQQYTPNLLVQKPRTPANLIRFPLVRPPSTLAVPASAVDGFLPQPAALIAAYNHPLAEGSFSFLFDK